jgi:hypothetical protein
MNTRDFTNTMTTLLRELTEGSAAGGAYILNRGDVGLLRSLDKLTAEDASSSASGGATIAAHVDHLRYGLSLMNRWSSGENPFDTASWGTSWRITRVSESEWRALRAGLRDEADRWLDAVGSPRDVSEEELNSVVGSIAHLAYHLGAIRQINLAARGPLEAQG